MGFCYGGLLAWLSSTRAKALKIDLKAAVGFYAGGIGKVASEDPSCPVQLHFGAEDDHIGKDQIDAVRNAHPDVQIFLYDGAGHAFANEAREFSTCPRRPSWPTSAHWSSLSRTLPRRIKAIPAQITPARRRFSALRVVSL